MQKQLLTSDLSNSCLRCSRSQMFFKIGVLKNFVIFTGKHLCWSLLLIKLTPKTSKRLQHRCFLVNIAKFLRTPFLRNTPVTASAVLKNSYIPRKAPVAEAEYIYLFNKYG